MSLEKKPGGFRSRAKGEKRAPAFGNRPMAPRPTRYQPGGDPRALGDVDLARAVAFDVLYRVNVEGTYANLALPKALTEYRLRRRLRHRNHLRHPAGPRHTRYRHSPLFLPAARQH